MPTPWYDSWKTTPPEYKVVANCEQCGADIHLGEEYTELGDGTKLCADSDCFDEYAREVLQPTTEYGRI